MLDAMGPNSLISSFHRMGNIADACKMLGMEHFYQANYTNNTNEGENVTAAAVNDTNKTAANNTTTESGNNDANITASNSTVSTNTSATSSSNATVNTTDSAANTTTANSTGTNATTANSTAANSTDANATNVNSTDTNATTGRRLLETKAASTEYSTSPANVCGAAADCVWKNATAECDISQAAAEKAMVWTMK